MINLHGEELLKQAKLASELYPNSSISQAKACGYESVKDYFNALLVAHDLASVSVCLTCGTQIRKDKHGLPI